MIQQLRSEALTQLTWKLKPTQKPVYEYLE